MLLLIARRVRRRKGGSESAGQEPASTHAAPAGEAPDVGKEDVADDARVEHVQTMLHSQGAAQPNGDAG